MLWLLGSAVCALGEGGYVALESSCLALANRADVGCRTPLSPLSPWEKQGQNTVLQEFRDAVQMWLRISLRALWVGVGHPYSLSGSQSWGTKNPSLSGK